MIIDNPLEVGDLVEVYINKQDDSKVVKVTCLHSGYYDNAYTGVTEDGKTVYFDFAQDWYVGREV